MVRPQQTDRNFGSGSIPRACWIPVALLVWVVWVVTLSRSAPHAFPKVDQGCQHSFTGLLVFHFDAGHPLCRTGAKAVPTFGEQAGSTGAIDHGSDELDIEVDHIEALDDSYGVLGP